VIDYTVLRRPRLEDTWKSVCICPAFGRKLPFLLSSKAPLRSDVWTPGLCGPIILADVHLKISRHLMCLTVQIVYLQYLCRLQLELYWIPVCLFARIWLRSAAMSKLWAGKLHKTLYFCLSLYHRYSWLGQNSSSTYWQRRLLHFGYYSRSQCTDFQSYCVPIVTFM